MKKYLAIVFMFAMMITQEKLLSSPLYFFSLTTEKPIIKSIDVTTPTTTTTFKVFY